MLLSVLKKKYLFSRVALAECEELKAKNQFLNNTLSDKEKMAKEDRNVSSFENFL